MTIENIIKEIDLSVKAIENGIEDNNKALKSMNDRKLRKILYLILLNFVNKDEEFEEFYFRNEKFEITAKLFENR